MQHSSPVGVSGGVTIAQPMSCDLSADDHRLYCTLHGGLTIRRPAGGSYGQTRESYNSSHQGARNSETQGMGFSVIMPAVRQAHGPEPAEGLTPQQRSASSRQALRGPGAHPARVRNHVWFFPYREAPRSGIRLPCACNRFQARGNIPLGKKNPQPQAVGDFRERMGGKFSHLRLMACRRTAPSFEKFRSWEVVKLG